MTGAMRREMARHPDEFDPRAFLKAATTAAREVCEQRLEAFGCAGQASRRRAAWAPERRLTEPRRPHERAAYAAMRGLHSSVRPALERVIAIPRPTSRRAARRTPPTIPAP
jgi:hypothetical protein